MNAFNNNEHNNEIINSRIGGFGGSDAKMFYKIGLNGLKALSATDKKRISVAKGIADYQPIAPTEAMQRGHDYEDYIFETKPNDLTMTVMREVKLSKYLAKNFATFAHADLYAERENYVIELKCTSTSFGETLARYQAQLQWYYMLGASKVALQWHNSAKDFDDCSGDVLSIVERDQAYIDALLNGIKLLDDAWAEEDLCMQCLTADDLLPCEAEEVMTLKTICKRIEDLEASAKSYKERILMMMRANGINYIEAEGVRITYVAPSVRKTFDKKALAKAMPELSLEAFEKETKVSDSIRISLK